MCKKIGFALLISLMLCSNLMGQDVLKIKDILLHISRAYDTSANLSFKLRFVNKIESASGKIASDKTEGKYALIGKNAFYIMGDIEVMQNDSFFVAVYNRDKFIIVSTPKSNASTQFFPFRETMDSLLKLSADKYLIKLNTSKSERLETIIFSAKDTLEKVKEFRLVYNSGSSMISSISYLFHEYKASDEDYKEENPQMILQKKTILIEFEDYSHNKLDTSILSEKKYIFFENGECKLTERYRDFKLYYSPSPVLKN